MVSAFYELGSNREKSNFALSTHCKNKDQSQWVCLSLKKKKSRNNLGFFSNSTAWSWHSSVFLYNLEKKYVNSSGAIFSHKEVFNFHNFNFSIKYPNWILPGQEKKQKNRKTTFHRTQRSAYLEG